MTEPENESSSWKDDLPTLILAVAVALIIRTFLYQTFYVPSESMLPSLLVGDHVFVNKFVYGPVVPGFSTRLPGLRKPERGEIIVFRFARDPQRGGIYPADQRPELPTDNFVKRLVGLPGDRLAYRDGRLWLNGEVLPLEKTGLTYEDPTGRQLEVNVESLGSCRHVVLDDPRATPRDMPEITVPDDRYFFMGDNRDNSHDGRMVGTVGIAELAGPAGLNYWSWNWTGSWLSLINPLTWVDNLSSKMRWSRMGRFVRCLEPGEQPSLVR